MMNISGKTVMVTGGAHGIGNEVAKTFLNQGCKVLITDIDETAGVNFAESSPDAFFIKADMSKANEILNVFSFIDTHWKTLDVLINNVGISIFKPLLELSVEEWDKVVNTNLRSAFICAQEFSRRHSDGTYGRIINMASTRHLMSEPNGEAYAASKGGLVSLTHALAVSMQNRGMTVNCISPGWIHNGKPEELTETDKAQHLAKRVGVAGDIANLCLFLCQPGNDFITGQNFYVDGGMTKKMIYTE
jgi:NAD(P)-dependent dehydrogenase (short-subunit alcohol dehydrogenase family)